LKCDICGKWIWIWSKWEFIRTETEHFKKGDIIHWIAAHEKCIRES